MPTKREPKRKCPTLLTAIVMVCGSQWQTHKRLRRNAYDGWGALDPITDFEISDYVHTAINRMVDEYTLSDDRVIALRDACLAVLRAEGAGAWWTRA